MKTKHRLSLVCFAAGLLALPSAASERVQIAFPTNNTIAAAASKMVEKPRVTLGTSQADVLARTGVPTLKLSANEWVYRNVQATRPGKGELSQDNLIVTFDNGRVVGLQLVKRHLLSHRIAEAKRAQPELRQGQVVAENIRTAAR